MPCRTVAKEKSAMCINISSDKAKNSISRDRVEFNVDNSILRGGGGVLF